MSDHIGFVLILIGKLQTNRTTFSGSKKLPVICKGYHGVYFRVTSALSRTLCHVRAWFCRGEFH